MTAVRPRRRLIDEAIVYCDYGLANLKVEDVEKPTPADDFKFWSKFVPFLLIRTTGTSSKARPRSCVWELG